jgi:hypothetical protein
VERVADWHEQVEPDLGMWSHKDRSATASTSDEFGTVCRSRRLVDRGKLLRAAEHNRGAIRITENSKPTRRFGSDHEVGGRRPPLDDRETRSDISNSCWAQIPTAIPKAGAT